MCEGVKMATMKFRVPTEKEEEIMRRNGVDPDGTAVIYRDDDTIHIRRHKTGDEITIKKGLRAWS